MVRLSRLASSIRPASPTRLGSLHAVCGLAISLSTFQLTALAQGTSQASPSGQPAALRNATMTQLPITDVTLYRSGVGSFVRQGRVSGQERISLPFDVSQINDVLKSLQVADLDGGRIDAVSLPSKEPLARRLSSFSVNIADNPAMGTLLERLRGTPVTLGTLNGSVSGTVLSVETRSLPQNAGDKAILVPTPTVNLLTKSGMKAISIPEIQTFVIDDPKIADELNRALTAVAESRAERSKTVDVAFSGDGERRVAMAYVLETPVWKTSYRLMLPELAEPGKPDDGKSGPVLKGWALVENTSDTDWTNVKLSLVSGRPVSFRMDLAEPLYVYRPEVAVPFIAGVMPKEYEGGSGGDRDRREKAGRGLNQAVGRAAMEVGAMPAPAAARMTTTSSMAPGTPGGEMMDYLAGSRPAASPDFAGYAPNSQATASTVGELFQFTVKAPVTIERQRSAMIPFIDAGLTGRRVSIYNRADRPTFPMRGIEVTNSSDVQLLPGPVSVYDGNTYAGDAQLGQVSPGDQRMLAYAVDLDVSVRTEDTYDRTIKRLAIRNGLIEETAVVTAGIAYTFDNKDLKKARTIIVEHPKMPGWELLDAKPINETGELYRFEVTLEPGKMATVTYKQRQTTGQAMTVGQVDIDTLVKYQTDGKISEKALAAIRKALDLQTAASTLQSNLENARQDLQTRKADQTQLVDMMAKLDRQNPNYATFSTRLTKASEQVEKIEADITKLRTDLEVAEKALRQYLENLNID
jgi:hypothetical protein